MIDQIENPLREALRQRALEVPADATTRLRSVEYHPRSARWTTPVSLGAGAGAAATAATVVSLVVLGGSQPAFAGWSPTPATAASSSQVAAAEAACEARLAARPPAPGQTPPSTAAGQGLTPVLTDLRGPYTVAIYSEGSSSTMTCFTGPSFTVVSSRSSSGQGTSVSGTLSASGVAGGGAASVGKSAGAGFSEGKTVAVGTTPADELQVSGSHFTLPNGSAYTLIEGQAGSDVTGTTLVLDDGQKVQATIEGGWFEAWWPGSTTAVTADVTTVGGTKTEQLPPWIQAPPPGAAASEGSSGSRSSGA